MDTGASVALRPPLESAAQNEHASIDARRPVCVLHPGYPVNVGSNILLSLVSTDGDDRSYGVHFPLVHTACVIIANNRFDGWLSASDDASSAKINLDDNAILPAGDYFFHVPARVDDNSASALASSAQSAPQPVTVPLLTASARDTRSYLYPTVPNFRCWSFPHGRMPSFWSRAVLGPRPQGSTQQPSGTPANMVKLRDVSCRLTNHSLVTELAHVLPVTEKVWFASNRMDLYGKSSSKAGQDVVDAEPNMMLLRSDIHTLWDQMKFSIVPKPSKDRWVYTVHVADETQELYSRYHNTELQPLYGIRAEFLFARFAWDIFPKAHGFLQERKKRLLAVRQEDGNTTVKEYSSEECERFCEDQGRGRSARASKKKRAHQEADGLDLDGVSFDSGISSIGQAMRDHQYDSNDEDSDGDGDEEAGWDDPFGRKRAERYVAMEREMEREAWGGVDEEQLLRGRKRIRI